MKKRSFTHAERSEVYRLCYQGLLGKLTERDLPRVSELFSLNPDEYGVIGNEARKAADDTVNPKL